MSRRNRKYAEPRLLLILRLFLGAVFIFSSVVKGIDPLGTAYRVEDYLSVFGWLSLMPYAIHIAFSVIIAEFLLGVAFIFKSLMKIAIPAMFLMMAFFTVVTYFDAVNNWVPDCGCFGDAVKLTNYQTFYKNIVLIVLNLIFLIKYKTYRKVLNPLAEGFSVIVFGAVFTAFVFYNYNHLPVVDFRDWKEGRSLITADNGKEKIYLTYRNKKTGEIKEYLSPDYPWRDSVWRSQWEFVDQRIDDSQVVKKYDLQIEDAQGNNLTKEIVEGPGYRFIVVSCYLEDASDKGMEKLSGIIDFLNKKEIPAVLLTASDEKEIENALNRWHLDCPAYFADDVQLKVMIRSNPGLILMHDGTVVKKWHFNDFPDTLQLKKMFP